MLKSLLLVTAVIRFVYAEGAYEQPMMEDKDAFQRAVRPLIRSFIFSQYDKFASSELTFRHLKTHVAEMLNVPYEMLKNDEISEVIEDETDAIANGCKGGELARTDCMALFGIKDEL